MSSIAKVRDISKDFWVQNPHMAITTPFAEFKKKEKNSSQIMIAIYLVYDAKSDFKRMGMDESEIMSDVSENFLNNIKFNWDNVASIVEAYKDKCRSRLHKKVEKLLNEVDAIDGAMENLSWEDPSEAELKVKLFDSAKKFYKEVIELQKMLNEEIAEVELESDYVPSMIEEYALKK